MSAQDTGNDIRRLRHRLAFIFAAVSAAVISGGIVYNAHYRSTLASDAGALLSSIARFKIDQITQWRSERINDTLSLLDSPIFSSYLNRLAENPGDKELRNVIRARLHKYLEHNKYRAAFLTGPDGKIVISAETHTTALCPEGIAMVHKADASGMPSLGDLYLSPGEPNRHLDLTAPAARTKSGKKLFLVLRIDPEDYLYPLLKTWPTNSRTGETLLVRKEGDQALFLNRLRNARNEAMTLKLPLSTPRLTAARVLKGESGIIRGKDYRGKEVLAAAQIIPGTNWGFIAKIDWDEVVENSSRVTVLIVLLGILLLAVAGGGTYLLFRIQGEEHLKTYRKMDSQASKLKVNYDLLTTYANDGILLVDSDTLQIKEANKKCRELYGYTAAEFLNLKITDLVQEAEAEAQKKRLNFSRAHAGAMLEATHKRKNGELFPAEISSAFIAAEGENYLFTIIRDISARKQAETTLRESEERYHSLFENMLNGFAYCRMLYEGDKPADFVYISVNAAFEKLTGLKEAAGKKVSEMIPYFRETDQALLETYARVARGGAPETFETYVKALKNWFNVSVYSPAKDHFVSVFEVITERKETEERLRESELKYRNLFNNAGIGMFRTSLDGSKFRDLNTAYLKILGRTREEIEGTPSISIWADPRERTAMVELLKANGRVNNFECRLLHKSGRVLNCITSLTLYPDQDILEGAIMDITEHKHIEEALRESERRLAALFSNLPGIAYRCKNDRNWTMEFLSEGCKKLTGYEITELVGQNALSFNQIIVPTDRDRVWREIQAALTENRNFQLTYDIRCKEGNIRTVWEQGLGVKGPNGGIEALEGFISDITERKRAEEARELNAQRTATLLQLNQMIDSTEKELSDFVLEEAVRLTRSRIGYLAFLNEDESVLTMYSWSRSAMAECAMAEKPLQYPVASTGLWGEAVRLRRAVITNDYGAPNPFKKGCPPGHVAMKRHLNVPIFDGPKIVMVVGVGNKDEEYETGDVQQLSLLMEGMWRLLARKRVETQREKLNQDLADKKQEMENFLYITTHDLRSPLVNIQGFSENLERYMNDLAEALGQAQLPAGPRQEVEKLTGDRIPGALKFVLESSRKMDGLITALLKVSRLGRIEMKPETVDMNELLKKVMGSLRYQQEEAGGKITVAILPPCKADPGAVSQLFSNLLDNAIKYRQEDRTLEVKVTGEVKEGSVIYTVEDNGAGIAEPDLHRIWNVFYQPERARGKKGEGIGLPTVRRIAEMNGGSIRAESKEGSGTVFYVELPAAGRT